MNHILLKGPFLKVKRAFLHINAIEKEVVAFSETRPYEIVFEPNEANHETIVMARLKEPLPELVDVLVGETIYNLRSSLDQLVGAMATLNGHTNLRGLQFPITADKEIFESEKTQKLISKISDRAKQIIGEIGPYAGNNDFLWVLNELSNIDKHRRLIALGHGAQKVNITGGTFNGGITIGAGPKWTNLSQGIELLRVGSVGDPAMYGTIDVEVDMAIEDIPMISDIPVASALSQTAEMVERVIVHFNRTIFN